MKLEKEKGIYTPHDAKLLVLKEFTSDYFIQVLAVSFFYMLDVFLHLAEELVDTINSNNVEDEVKAWMIFAAEYAQEQYHYLNYQRVAELSHRH